MRISVPASLCQVNAVCLLNHEGISAEALCTNKHLQTVDCEIHGRLRLAACGLRLAPSSGCTEARYKHAD